jgi:type II secretory pathway pseudopilin PulG
MKFMVTRNALTLVELVVVLCILVALSGLVLPICSGNLTTAAETATRSSLTQIRDAMMDYWRDTKAVTLDGVSSYAIESQRFDLEWLFSNPVTNDTTNQFDPNSRMGWDGPYIAGTTADVVQWGGMTLLDGWNHQIVVQYVNPSDELKDVRVVSAGPNGVIDIPAAIATSALTSGNVGDDIYVAIALR